MKICKIYIKGFQQFQDVELDFTNPQTREPAEKICFIGRNGTGKSTLLRIVDHFIYFIGHHINNSKRNAFIINSKPLEFIYIKFKHKDQFYFFVFFHDASNPRDYLFLNEETIQERQLKESINSYDNAKTVLWQNLSRFSLNDALVHNLYKELIFTHNSSDLLIYSPPESINNLYVQVDDVPNTDLNNALGLFENFPYRHIVSSEKVNDFWNVLVYQIKKRDDEREKYETLPGNINKTKAQLIAEFDSISPKILNGIADVWNNILKQGGLEFDVEGAKNPVQLRDNLKAYIILNKSKERIKYSELSTGIRNFIFRLGHIYSLYFDRAIERGILLIDEPENSLFPDFLLDLVELYKQVVLDARGQNNTQMFFSTHSPIIAAQFKPYERVILDWNDNATIGMFRGTAAEGDDPNDVLKKDFGLHELMGPKGVEQWMRYLDLRKRLKKVDSVEEKMQIASEINHIGQLYNFPA